jgi:hypothetical protein
VSWDAPTYLGHAYTEIWAAQELEGGGIPVLGDAVMVGMSPGAVFAHNLGEEATRWYWVRFVNIADEKGPYNAVDGTQGSTSPDPTVLLDLLEGQITEGQLFTDLGKRIDRIDNIAQAPQWGSIDSYVVGDLVARSGVLYAATQPSTNVQPPNAAYWDVVGPYTSLIDASVGHSAAIGTIQTTKVDAAGALASVQSYVAANTNFADLGAISSQVSSHEYALTDPQGALAQSIDNLQVTIEDVNGSSVGAAIAQESTVRAQQTGDLFAQYTVKVDVNGYVSGFGLASTEVDGVPSSSFVVRSDSFAIGTPGGVSPAPSKPFIVRTTPTTINGRTVPAGTYISDAFIGNGTINNAMIGVGVIDEAHIANATILDAYIQDLDANVITSGFISADRIEAESIAAGKIDTRGLSIKALDGTVILASGTSLDWSNVGGTGKPADNATVGADWNTNVTNKPTIATSLAELDTAAAQQLDKKSVTFYQATQPSSGESDLGDVWFDTNDNYKMYAYSGSAWVQVQDSATASAAASEAATAAGAAAALADSKVLTFFQTSTPSGASTGDLWYSDSTKLMRRYNGSAWVNVANAFNNTNQLTDGAGLGTKANWGTVTGRPTSLAELDSAAANQLDGKSVTYYQSSQPASGDTGDIWFDTNDSYKMYSFNGASWVLVQDSAAASAAAQAAQADATVAQSTADGKITTFYNSASGQQTGDLLYSGSLLYRWSGSSWNRISNDFTSTSQLSDGAGLGQTAVWSSVSGAGKPADNADVTSQNTAASVFNQGNFATLDQITPSNVSTYIASTAIDTAYIANGAITLAKIDTASIGSLSAISATIGTFQSAATGARLKISDDVIEVYDASGRLRVKIGNLA